MKAFFEQSLEAVNGAAHALGSIKKSADERAEGAARRTLVVDLVPALRVGTAGQNKVVDDALLPFGRKDFRAAQQVVGASQLVQERAVAAAASKASRAPEAVKEHGVIALAVAPCEGAYDGFMRKATATRISA